MCSHEMLQKIGTTHPSSKMATKRVCWCRQALRLLILPVTLATAILSLSTADGFQLAPKPSSRILNAPLGGQSCWRRVNAPTRDKSRGLKRTAPSSTTSSSSNLHMLVDYSEQAYNFFFNIRTPASFLAGSSLASLFLFREKTVRADVKPLERYTLDAYHFFMLAAYALSLSTIVISTAATVTLMQGGYNPKAKTAYELMMRHFAFEFISCRWGFLVSLFCFILGVVQRAILEFDLYKKGRINNLCFVLFSCAALATHLLSYINQTLYTNSNLLVMTGSLLKVRIIACVPVNERCCWWRRMECNTSCHSSPILVAFFSLSNL